jgi:hypothetical protein
MLLTLLAVGIMATSASADLIISEITDGPLSGGNPTFTEITNTGDSPVDLSNYSFGNFNNGGTTLGGGAASVLSGILEPCDSYVILWAADTDTVFSYVYGFNADFYMGGKYINGDDVQVLFLGAATGDGTDATIVDIVGVIGVDGTGQPWEHLDTWGYRNADICNANTTWTASEWTIQPPNSGDGMTAEEWAAVTTPGYHDVNCCTVGVEEQQWGTVKKLYR